jgi:tRNA nucleotidyltransferase (CCA-adding enzyme)
LLELGIPQGPAIGRTLDELLARVVEEPELNTRERLLELAEELR